MEKLFVRLLKLRQQHFDYVLYQMRSHAASKNDHDTMRKQYMEQAMKDGINDSLNFTSSVCVVPYKGEIYVKFFLGDYMERFKTSGFFKKYLRDFHYQNSTDRPKEVKAYEWAHRRKVWDAIGEFGRDWEHMGFVFDIFNDYDCARAFWKIDAELMKQFNIPDPFAPKEKDAQKG